MPDETSALELLVLIVRLDKIRCRTIGTLARGLETCHKKRTQNSAALDDGDAAGGDERGALAQRRCLRQRRRRKDRLKVSQVGHERVRDVELLEKPDHALGLRVLRRCASVLVSTSWVGRRRTLRWWRVGMLSSEVIVSKVRGREQASSVSSPAGWGYPRAGRHRVWAEFHSGVMLDML